MGRKLGAVPFGGGGARSPSNTMCPGPRATCIPSFILIRPTVRLQCTNVTDRQTDRSDRQRSDSIGEPFYKRSPKNVRLFCTVNKYSSRIHYACASQRCSLKTLVLVPRSLEDMSKSSAVAEMGDCGHNKHGPKTEGCCTHFGGAGSLSNTTWHGPRPTFVPSGILIHPAIWPQ